MIAAKVGVASMIGMFNFAIGFFFTQKPLFLILAVFCAISSLISLWALEE